MSVKTLFILFVGSPMALAANPTSERIAETDGYKLVWHDEFEIDGPLDSKDWSFESGFVRNHEAQYYQPENAVCKNGLLVIEARKENKPNPRYSPTRGDDWKNAPNVEYTSSSAMTKGKHEWVYGRFEIRAKIDVREGSWPAFWTLGAQGAWPGNGEIDIMEYYRKTLSFNVAWQGANATAWNSKKIALKDLPEDFGDQFHTWRMDWDEKSIALFLDDQEINKQELSKTVNGGRGALSGVNPFINRPVYLLVNLAIGGDNGGDPSKTSFPIRYEIDYVRVFQKPAAATQPSK